jgi:hypothetical protein
MKDVRWSRSLLVEFLRNHPFQPLLLEDQRTQARLRGQVPLVNDLDVCSGILAEAPWYMEPNLLDISLTFHDQFIGVHVMLEQPETGELALSLPWEIPYVDLHIELLSAT